MTALALALAGFACGLALANTVAALSRKRCTAQEERTFLAGFSAGRDSTSPPVKP